MCSYKVKQALQKHALLSLVLFLLEHDVCICEYEYSTRGVCVRVLVKVEGWGGVRREFGVQQSRGVCRYDR